MNPRPLPPARTAAATSSDPGTVPGDIRDQIRRLQDDGGSYRAIAAAPDRQTMFRQFFMFQ
jgi:hypothetical protein